MSYSIHITAAAERDMLHASDHMEYVLENPKVADDLLDEAENQINSLSEFSERNKLVQRTRNNETVLASWGIRFILINNYLAFLCLFLYDLLFIAP